MKVGESVGHLIDIPTRAALREVVRRLGELLVQFSLRGKLKHQEDTLLVVEEAIESEDIRMAEVLLNFDLPTDLFLHLILDDLRLVLALESKDEARLDLRADHVHSSELALAEGTADFEVT